MLFFAARIATRAMGTPVRSAKRCLKQTLVAAKQAAQQKPGGQLPRAAQMRDEGWEAIGFASAFGGDLDIGLLTGIARQTLSFFWRQSGGSGQPHRECLGRAAREIRTQRRWQIRPRQERRAQTGIMAVPLDHPPDGKIQKFGTRIDGERPQGRASAGFGQPGRHRRRDKRPERDGRLNDTIRGRSKIDQFRIGKQRRAPQHDRGNI